MRLTILIAAAVLLTGCPSKNVRPTAAPAPAPSVISVPEVRYMPLEAWHTRRCSWIRDGKLEEMPTVSRGRKSCLIQYEDQLEAIERKQGSLVKD